MIENQRGTSLIEVMAAMAVLSILAWAALTTFSYSLKVNSEARMETTAVNLAQATLEELKTGSWGEIAPEGSEEKPVTVKELNQQQFYLWVEARQRSPLLKEVGVNICWCLRPLRKVRVVTYLVKSDKYED